MAEVFNGYKTADNRYFDTKEEALLHEANILLRKRIAEHIAINDEHDVKMFCDALRDRIDVIDYYVQCYKAYMKVHHASKQVAEEKEEVINVKRTGTDQDEKEASADAAGSGAGGSKPDEDQREVPNIPRKGEPKRRNSSTDKRNP